MGDEYQVIRDHLAALHTWCEKTAGPLVSQPARELIDEAVDAANDAEHQHRLTVDLLIEATREN